jgi:hypothetical protein
MNNAIRNFTRTAAMTGGLCAAAAASTCLAQAPQPSDIAPAQSVPAAHAFDFFFGTWRVHNRRLRKALADETGWDSFEGIQICEPLLGGRANYDELRDLNNGPIGMSIHLFDIATQSWSSRWVSAADGRMQPPLKGVFVNGTGVFEGDDVHEGKPIRVRYTWSRMSTPTPRWEQAFSGDGGKTWETNWVMDYARMVAR